MSLKFIFNLTISFSLVALWSCSGTSVKDSESPQEIYEAAVKAIGEDNYLEATDLLNEVKRRFPQSNFAAMAELQSANLEYNQENYLEAAALYKNFVNLHPAHPEAAYSQHRMAISYLKNAPENIARDQSSAVLAARSAQDLQNKYPNSPLSKESTDIYYQARLRLAEKEAYVARFYEKQEAYESALIRWGGVEKNFQDIKTFEGAKKLFEEATERQAKLRERVKPENENKPAG